MLVGKTRRHSAARCAVDKSDLKKIGLDYLLDRVLFFMYGGGKGAESNGTAVEFLNDGPQELGVHFVQPVAVDLHSVKSLGRNLFGDAAIVIYLGEIAHAPKEAVDYTGCPTPATGDLVGAGLIYFDT